MRSSSITFNTESALKRHDTVENKSLTQPVHRIPPEVPRALKLISGLGTVQTYRWLELGFARHHKGIRVYTLDQFLILFRILVERL